MIKPVDTVTDSKTLENAIKRFREKGIILPTFKQQRNPELIPDRIKERLKTIGLWDINPLNLFRITWKNIPFEKGGLFGRVNFLEIPRSLSGVESRIFMLIGKWFPTGAHKVGAAYGCLAPSIVTGGFDPTYHKAVWPSTGNYCRGGAFDSKLMGTDSVAILPEEMSKERFAWLRDIIGSEVIATPGCESNVREIYDKCKEIRQARPECVIFNQFDEFGNGAWHYNVTGPAAEDLFNHVRTHSSRLAAFVSATGSAGTIATGDYLKKVAPHMKIVASEALQCPTLLMNGFGGHRIEGIGDKHVPWIHNVKNTDVVTAVDDEDCIRLLRLFNEKAGQDYLISAGIEPGVVADLPLLGISGISNLISAVKTSRHFEMTADDVIITVATDSADMYRSRVEELRHERGEYITLQAARDFERCLAGTRCDNMKELTYNDRKAIHNLKYYTWVEQQGKEAEDLNRLWYDNSIWETMFGQVNRWDELIDEFNGRTGLLDRP